MLAGSAAGQGVGDTPMPRVGEIPTGCNTNGYEVSTSVLGGNCFGGPLRYFITISNPHSVPPAVTCQASHVTVRFWGPDNSNVNPEDVCGSTGETIILTPTPLTLAPGASVSFAGGNGPGEIPALLFTAAGPGPVTAYVCVQGISNLSLPGTAFASVTGIDTSIGATPTCTVGPAAVCPGESICAAGEEGAGPYSVSWSGPGEFSANAACVAPSVAGTYTAIVTDANGCASAGCSAVVEDCTLPPAPSPTPPCVFCVINEPGFQRELLGPLVPQTACGIGAGMAFAGVFFGLVATRHRRR